ncbi:MAG: 6,7-dimethyl-8-ribityllumazine synthase [Persicimonas sp.]
MKTIEGDMLAEGKRFVLVAARFNDAFAEKLLDGAIDALVRHGADREDLAVVRCPGSFELPQVAARLAESGDYDAIVCLGVLIRGATPHFDHIASQTASGIGRVGVDSGVPTTFGVLTCDTVDQAIERSGSKAGNKGAEAALAAIEMANLYDNLEGSR